VGLNPIDPRARLALAGTRAALGKTSAALSEYRRVLSLLPDPQTSLRCHVNLALLLDELGDPVGATFHLREASRIAPSSAATLEAQARVLQHHAPASEQSELAWRRVLEVVPDHGEAHFRVGLTSLARGHHEEALRQMNAALEANPSLVSALFHRGEILARLNRFGEARDSLFECMKRCGARGRDMPLWEKSWALAQALDRRLRQQEEAEEGGK
jgi:tetratricopeptide (TPR) repeat protein